ncbi:SHOCT domain-containing protein [Candidatus Nitrosarchaeum limnium]|uniref:SHOCT domain-containing protein n=1 Tax=Candidatus Nitrosarchaeum limnium BG20 TaxID=859192 RepID=S2EKD7_9ARCH|nr:SHOCT domain-containing protein [Candidatus Nitrosarchaeum limnium]EPA05117.1 hypothetical protein BG20_I1121 [Candidatus Nitrosarchaeum limnium BG20]
MDIIENNNEKSEKNIKKNKAEHFQDLTKTYENKVERGKQLGKESLEKINEMTTSSVDFIKSKPQWKSLKNNSLKIKEKSVDSAIMIKKNSPKFYRKVINGFFYFFESIVGRVKIGTQYGTSSIEVLEKLAKLKELGIITEEEFTKKKKKILDRI